MTKRGFDHNSQNGIYVIFYRSQCNWKSFCNKSNPVKRIAVYGTGRYVHLICERGAVVEYAAPTCAKVFAPRGREAPWWQLLTRHTVYVHLFYLIFKNIFWHVSAGCLLTIL